MNEKNDKNGKRRLSANEPAAKAAIIGFLAILFLIPLNMVRDIIHERAGYRHQAETGIRQSWAESQTVTGPVLAIPYTAEESYSYFDQDLQKPVRATRNVIRTRYVLPDTLEIDTTADLELRGRGLYEIPVYTATVSGTATFRFEGEAPTESEDTRPFLFFSVGDIRGIGGNVEVVADGEARPIQPGTGVQAFPSGFHAPLENPGTGEHTLRADFSFSLKGSTSLAFIPLGKDTAITIASPWPHPSFGGRYLPETREIGDDGFRAHWNTGFLATDMERRFLECTGATSCNLSNASLNVTFYQPVDIYQQALRAAKYGILFIALTFALFFLFEILKAMQVHPVQYALVGSALALFFLLLVSLSEHLAFGLSYALSAAAVAGLLGYYVSFVLRSAQWGGIFAGLVTAVYALLYAILASEDNALLMGSLFLFGMLAAIMVLTRKVDWYGRAEKAKAE
ncbi:MAG: cell envelope integrity protein CreD [Alphaproteobacteria bacterium]|nr:cell envelope integrity protein CreD [Alphaproteobacteria bacterium]